MVPTITFEDVTGNKPQRILIAGKKNKEETDQQNPNVDLTAGAEVLKKATEILQDDTLTFIVDNQIQFNANGDMNSRGDEAPLVKHSMKRVLFSLRVFLSRNLYVPWHGKEI